MTTIEDWKRAIKSSEEHRKYVNLCSLLNHWGLIAPTVALLLDAQTRLNKIDPAWEINYDRHSIEIHEEGSDDWGPITSITEIESLETLIELFEEKGG